MEDDEPKALIVRPASSLQWTHSGAEKVLSRIVFDVLTIARGRDIANSSVRKRIGKCELREQDYRQIVTWAQESGKSPEELVSLLEAEEDGSAFAVEDGSIIEIAFPKKRIFPQRILRISHLPNLVRLRCSENELTELLLSKNPQLRELNCSGNQLTELDTSKNPQLRALRCDNNQINELDIRENYQLKWLNRDPRVRIIKHDGQYFKRRKF